MAGMYGPKDASVTFEDAPGGSAKAIGQFLLNGISAKDIAEHMESTGVGDTWRERIPTGIKDSPEVTLEGLWDTTGTTGSHAIFGTVDADPQSVGRELVITFGDSKTWTRDYHLVGYEVVIDLGSVQLFRADLVATGAAVWGP